VCGAERLINRIFVTVCMASEQNQFFLNVLGRQHQTREPANLFYVDFCVPFDEYSTIVAGRKHIKLFVVGRLIMRNTKLSLAYFLFSLTHFESRDMQCNFCLFRALMADDVVVQS
jgi:hypothetical protein